MSVIEPTIDDLLSVTDENRYLLCEMAARRARDINDMMRNQHNRAEQLADIDDVSAFLSDDDGHAPNPLSIAFDEIAPKKDASGKIVSSGDLSYDNRAFKISMGLPVPPEPDPVEQDEEAEVADELVVEQGEVMLGGPAVAPEVDDEEPPITVDDMKVMLEDMDV